ncbi:hypothetical protein LXA43DRAFT_953893 [Ganoderma leucocontextum]|nr:hypothetical protein LXA43DRAFT_953893 [Ganoderma leucocontextum]
MASPLPGLEDILHHILAHLAADLRVANVASFDRPDSQSAHQTLARLARAHGTFTRPALAVLWRYLRSDRPLLYLLCVLGIAHTPPQKHQRNLPNQPSLEMCGTFATHGSSWARFQAYASLVRRITLDPFVHALHPPSLLQNTFWCQLSSALGNGTPILPRLEVVTLFSLEKPFRFSSFDMGPLCLLNPSIRALHIFLPRPGAEAGTDLRQVLSASLSSLLNLELLSVQVPVLVLDLESLPQSHPRLCCLQLDTSFQVHFNHLMIFASFPSLEHLSISLGDLAAPQLPVTFSGLRSLLVSSGELSAIGALIAHADAPQLRSLSIFQTHGDSNRTCQELPTHLRRLTVKCPHLTRFCWNSTQHHIHPAPGSTVQLTLTKLIRPLLSLRALRHFSAWFCGLIITPYSPADFGTIAEAWPDLETFDFLYYGKRGAVGQCYYVDLEFIICFARHCPRLRDLNIPVVQFDSNASLAAVHPPMPHWPCIVFVEHVLCPGGEEDEDRRERCSGAGWQRCYRPRQFAFHSDSKSDRRTHIQSRTVVRDRRVVLYTLQ